MRDSITYGDWTIWYDPPPIPIRTMDWHFAHRDFDASWEGEEDGWVSNGLCGSAESVEACKREINAIEEERFTQVAYDSDGKPYRAMKTWLRDA